MFFSKSVCFWHELKIIFLLLQEAFFLLNYLPVFLFFIIYLSFLLLCILLSILLFIHCVPLISSQLPLTYRFLRILYNSLPKSTTKVKYADFSRLSDIDKYGFLLEIKEVPSKYSSRKNHFFFQVIFSENPTSAQFGVHFQTQFALSPSNSFCSGFQVFLNCFTGYDEILKVATTTLT